MISKNDCQNRYSSKCDPVLLLLIGCGLIVRLSNLRGYYPNVDELMYLYIAKGSSLSDVWQRGLSEMLPPFGHFVRFFYLKFGESIFFHRMTSLIPGLLCILLSYRIGKNFIGKIAAIIFASLTAFSISAVTYSVIIRNYSLFFLLLLLSMNVFFHLSRESSTRKLILYSILITLTAGVHFSGFIVLFAFGLVRTISLLLRKDYAGFISWIAVHIAPMILALILYHYYFSPGSYGRGWLNFVANDAPTLVLKNDEYANYYIRFIHVFWGLIILHIEISVCLALFFLIGLFLLAKRKDILFESIGTVFLTQIALSFMHIYPFSGVRYCFNLFPFAALGISAAIQQCVVVLSELKKFNKDFIRKIATFIFSIAVISHTINATSSNLYFSSNPELPITSDSHEKVLALLKERGEADILIVNKATWLQILYDMNQGKEMYGDIDFGYLNYYGADIYFDGQKYFWEYALPDSLPLLINKIVEKVDLSTKKNFWFAILGTSDYSILSLFKCLKDDTRMTNVIYAQGTLLFSLKKEFALQILMKNKSFYYSCLADSQISQMGALFGVE